MSWSFSIGKIAGTEIRVHLTFFILLAWIAIVYYQTGGPQAMIFGLSFIITLFACVIAHEFGHILVARKFGIRTPDVTLLPIGGVARLERMPKQPLQEILIALAGPAVNIVIAIVLLIIGGANYDPESLRNIENPNISFLSKLAMVNIFLALFNLIPAFPMDGGRVLRAILAFRLNRTRATRIAANTGQMFAFFLGFLGLMGNPILIFIAIFVYLAAGAEVQGETLSFLSEHRSARDTMISEYVQLEPEATVNDAADALLRTTQHEFPIVDDNEVLKGILTRTKMIESLAKEGAGARVGDIMEKNITTVMPETSLAAALAPLQNKRDAAVGIVDRTGRFVGYITLENVAEMLMIENARSSSYSR